MIIYSRVSEPEPGASYKNRRLPNPLFIIKFIKKFYLDLQVFKIMLKYMTEYKPWELITLRRAAKTAMQAI